MAGRADERCPAGTVAAGRGPGEALVPGADRGRDGGSVTAELALALPAVVGVLLLALAVSSAATTQLRCADAARGGARAAALGEDSATVAAVADRLAGDGADVRVVRDGSWVTVTVRRPLAGGGVVGAGLTAQGRATARVEP